jgi:hypothetical protein
LVQNNIPQRSVNLGSEATHPSVGVTHPKALKAKHPTLSIATADWLSGATEGTLRKEPAFQDEASAAVTEEMTRPLCLTDATDRKLKGGAKHAKALGS